MKRDSLSPSGAGDKFHGCTDFYLVTSLYSSFSKSSFEAPNRAFPVIGQVPKLCSWSYSIIRVTLRRIINIAADFTYILIHNSLLVSLFSLNSVY